jgi:MFS family permease
VVIAAILWKLKSEWAEARGERFDLGGSLIYGVALVGLMYGFSLLPALSGAWLIIAGILGIAAFIWWEMRVRSPVLDMSLYLQYVKDLTPQSAGLILVAQPAMMTIVSPFAGRVCDRVAPRVIASIGMALTTMGLTMLVFVDQDTLTAFVVVSLIVLGPGFGLFSSPNTNAVMSAVEKRFYGVASGTLATMRMTGQMFSMGIAMLIISIFVGRVEITPEHFSELVTSMQVAFIVFATLCFGGIFASLARGKNK